MTLPTLFVCCATSSTTKNAAQIERKRMREYSHTAGEANKDCCKHSNSHGRDWLTYHAGNK